jgi:hypothetical protein
MTELSAKYWTSNTGFPTKKALCDFRHCCSAFDDDLCEIECNIDSNLGKMKIDIKKVCRKYIKEKEEFLVKLKEEKEIEKIEKLKRLEVMRKEEKELDYVFLEKISSQKILAKISPPEIILSQEKIFFEDDWEIKVKTILEKYKMPQENIEDAFLEIQNIKL